VIKNWGRYTIFISYSHKSQKATHLCLPLCYPSVLFSYLWCCTLSIVHLACIYSLYPCQCPVEQYFYLSWVCFGGWLALGALLVVCLGEMVIQISWSAIHLYVAFASLMKKCWKKEKKKKRKKKKGVNEVIGIGVWLWDCLIPLLRFLWGLLPVLKLWCEVIVSSIVVEVFFAP